MHHFGCFVEHDHPTFCKARRKSTVCETIRTKAYSGNSTARLSSSLKDLMIPVGLDSCVV